MGWPAVPLSQFRDSAAKARACSIPAALANAGRVLGVSQEKLATGKDLIRKYCVPKHPTKNDASLRRHLEDNPVDAASMDAYVIRDVDSEREISRMLPDLSPYELAVWLVDQKVNVRGVRIDRTALEACIDVVERHSNLLITELTMLTGGAVTSGAELDKMMGWCAGRNVTLKSLDKAAVEKALKNPVLPPDVRRVLEIRQSLSMASVKKLNAIRNRMNSDDRVRDNFVYCGADRTGRWAGRGIQPQNLPSSGPKVEGAEWNEHAVERALHLAISTGDVSSMGDPMEVISGCIRGLIVPTPGYDFICADYSAIEAVVLAFLAGEQWRMDVFNSHGKIYEMSASKITGVPFEEFIRHKQETGEHHPMRKKVGKVAELASGYQGSVSAWKNFGADKHMADSVPQGMTIDDYILQQVRKWREASPSIVNFWYGLENAARSAIQQPGMEFSYRGITYYVQSDILFCRLLSGRTLKYHNPRLHPDVTPWGKEVLKITFMGTDSFTKQWVRQDTYGGKLTENVVQATARDILAHAELNIDASGIYSLVMHIHDETVSEVQEGAGSIEEYESLMNNLPHWCKDWPVRAAGGWRGKRFKKD
jgi:DNA polymerase